MRFAVIGSPVGHSKSPAMHEAAYRALGLPHTYEKLETTEAELPSRMAALRDGTFAGLNVTVPHKTRVLDLVDELDASARDVGAANTLVRDGSRIRAHNTDAEALAQELTRLGGDRFRRRTGLVVGTGGAARAAIAAFGRLGCRRVVILGRRPEALEEYAARILGERATTSVVTRPIGPVFSPPRDVVAIVQATSCGMRGAAPGSVVADAIDWAAVAPDAVALDVVYAPRETPFLLAARARGIACDDGLGMLARQGALAFELWLGVLPPLDVMLAAISAP